ncbi:MAG: hypothetical protein AAF634_01715, partial [Bacteroidota bacterium]
GRFLPDYKMVLSVVLRILFSNTKVSSACGVTNYRNAYSRGPTYAFTSTILGISITRIGRVFLLKRPKVPWQMRCLVVQEKPLTPFSVFWEFRIRKYYASLETLA